ncbi:MAG: class I tRNA ligase family protein, partial [Clostridia bacterium]|nr:class I tRNA ligase family protein [Clostridia bacterium]
FPHHENEIAQSECANGCTFANYWLHNGYINIDNRKMSKSLGNFFTVRDIAEEFDYEVIRLFMLSAHYRSPINFSKTLMEAAKSSMERVYTCLENLDFFGENAEEKALLESEKEYIKKLDDFKQKYIDAMDDDLNTADAISVIFEIVAEANKAITANSGSSLEAINYTKDLIRELGGVLGLFVNDKKDEISPEIEALLEERKTARAEKNWAKSDEIRDKLKAMGVIVKDTAQGQQITFE